MSACDNRVDMSALENRVVRTVGWNVHGLHGMVQSAACIIRIVPMGVRTFSCVRNAGRSPHTPRCAHPLKQCMQLVASLPYIP